MFCTVTQTWVKLQKQFFLTVEVIKDLIKKLLD